VAEQSGNEEYAASRLEVRPAAERLAQAALVRVRARPSGGVRVEDYLTALGAMTGEAAIVAAEIFDVETAGLTPGSPVFGPQINVILSGDTTEIADMAPNSVVGILAREAGVAPALLDQVERVYKLVATSVGKTEWGHVATSLSEDHRPSVLPIQVAFDLRDAADTALEEAGLPRSLRHVPCALALAIGLRQVAAAIDMEVAVTLALEVTFGMAKMAPMPKSVFAQLAAEHRPT
jgi:hypothetical protein